MLQNVLISKIKDFKLLNCHTLSIHENNFSTYDIVSDFQAGFEYMEGQTFEEIVTDLNDSRVANETSLKFAKAPTRTCSMISESGGSFTFSCVKPDYVYGVLTFIFIFAPSANVLRALMGPAIGGPACILWGTVMCIVGCALIQIGVGQSVTMMLFGFIISPLGVILLSAKQTYIS